ncbi:MAG: BatD family protein [Endomicrobia bacterium]|nr:BatD family protein [Endomicrobiia bacterium]
MTEKHMKILDTKILLYLALMFIINPFIYADINISASVDKNIIGLDEQINLQVVVSGDVTNLPQPNIPQMPDFQIYSSGRSQSISIINGRVNSSVTYSYVLVPKRVGEFEIPTISVVYQGKTYQTQPIKIKVEKSQPTTKQQIPLQKDVYKGTQRDLFVETFVDKKTAYVDEQITLTFRFYTRINLLSQPQYSPPDTTGFITEDLPPQKNYYTVIDGQRYYVSEIRTALFPTTAGKFVIGPASVKCVIEDFDVDDFFSDNFFKRFFSQGKEIVLRSQPIEVNVLPLPKPQPKDFYGSVGNFRISVSIDKQKLQQNETTFLNIKITGVGNIKSVMIPKEFIQQLFGNTFTIYDPVSSYEIKKENYLVKGSKTFKVPVTPTIAGNLVIPQIPFVYFNPNTKQYETTVSDKLQVEVSPQVSTGITDIKKDSKTKFIQQQTKLELEDIRYIKTKFTIVNKTKNNFLLLVQFLPPLFWLGITGFLSYQKKLEKNLDRYRATKALTYAIRKVKKIKTENSKQFVAEIYDIVSEYLANKLYKTKESLNIDEIKQILERKINSEVLMEFINFWEEINFYRFAPTQINSIKTDEWKSKVIQILRKLEYELQNK